MLFKIKILSFHSSQMLLGMATSHIPMSEFKPQLLFALHLLVGCSLVNSGWLLKYMDPCHSQGRHRVHGFGLTKPAFRVHQSMQDLCVCLPAFQIKIRINKQKVSNNAIDRSEAYVQGQFNRELKTCCQLLGDDCRNQEMNKEKLKNVIVSGLKGDVIIPLDRRTISQGYVWGMGGQRPQVSESWVSSMN